MKPILAVLVALVLVAGCATFHQMNSPEAPQNPQTGKPAGKPEVIVRGKVLDKAAPQIVNWMVNRGYSIKKSSQFVLTFEKPPTGFKEGFGAEMLLKSKFSHVYRAEFTTIELDSTTRILVSFWLVADPGSGFENTETVTPKNVEEYQSFLDELKTSLEKP